ncbi:DUF1403 family protein [Sulfitobacter sp.]|jgi:hypothetical protein|uniref:DUF1403 family protein n=1 Tax=Sulfitobacter sp. TaxID=1903071 RepID=UPI0039E22EA4
MKPARAIHDTATDSVPRMPSWVTLKSAQSTEDVAFLSGAGLSHLHSVLASAAVPQGLLRARLALRAAEAGMAIFGRPERAADLRDAVHLLRPGDQPGPAGEVYQMWDKAAGQSVSVSGLGDALPMHEAAQIGAWLDAGQGGPVVRAASVIETVLTQAPRAETAALILADAALSQVLGWRDLVPLLGFGLKPGDLRKTGDDLRVACHKAIVSSSGEAVKLASDLTRRAGRLNAVAPKLRAKGSDAAVEMFLTRDAVAPARLTSLRSDRAARRLCDRLVELGVVRELTGRDTFRLYGV